MKNVEGKLRDIAVDDEGRVWIASNMMTGFDVNASRYQRFGPGQYFTSQYVNCVAVDQDGSVWTGTGDKGLYFIQWEVMTVNILLDTPLDCKNTLPTAALSVKVSGGGPPFSRRPPWARRLGDGAAREALPVGLDADRTPLADHDTCRNREAETAQSRSQIADLRLLINCRLPIG